MRSRSAILAVAALVLITSTAIAAEPLIGTWQLQGQELNGHKKESEPITLRVTQKEDRLLFAFSVFVNNIDFVSMTYTAKLDGSEADVKNARGEKVGTIRITRPSASHYRLILKGDNHPESAGSLTVSDDGKILTSEASTMQSGRADRLVQTFSRE